MTAKKVCYTVNQAGGGKQLFHLNSEGRVAKRLRAQTTTALARHHNEMSGFKSEIQMLPYGQIPLVHGCAKVSPDHLGSGETVS